MPVDMKETIAAAFVALSQEKPIDKITVKDLVERCGISRQAFYYHFQDILDVMEWSIRQIVNGALQSSLRAQTPQQSVEAFIRISAEHERLLDRLWSSQRHAQVERIFVDAMRSSIRQVITAKRPDLMLNHQDLEVALNFYAYGLAGAVFENCKSGAVDTALLSDKLCRLLSGQMIQF